MTENRKNLSRIPARVMMSPRPGSIRVLIGPGMGMLDGGAPRDIPMEIIPPELRTPNTEFTLVRDPGDEDFIEVEPIE